MSKQSAARVETAKFRRRAPTRGVVVALVLFGCAFGCASIQSRYASAGEREGLSATRPTVDPLVPQEDLPNLLRWGATPAAQPAAAPTSQPAVRDMLAPVYDDPQALAAILARPEAKNASKVGACGALRDLGRAAAPATGALVASLDGDSTEIVAAARDALAAIGPDAVPALVEALKSKHAEFQAMQVLGLLGKEAKPAAPFLLDRLRNDPDAGNRTQAAGVLGAIGPVLDDAAYGALMEALVDPDETARLAAQSALLRVRPYTQEFEWVPLALSAQSNYASFAIGAIRKIGDLPAPPPLAVRAVARGLDSPVAEVRTEAAQALLRTGPAAEVAAPDLAAALRPPELRHADQAAKQEIELGGRAEEYALRALVRLGPRAKGAIPTLVALLGDPPTGDAAALALLTIGPDAAPALVEAAKGADPTIRASAIEAIGWIAPADAATTNAIVAALDDGDRAVRHVAMSALAHAQPTLLSGEQLSAVRQSLLRQIADRAEAEDALCALRNLGTGELARADLASVASAISGPDVAPRMRAAELLGSAGPAAAVAETALLKMANDRSPQARLSAARALALIDPQGRRLGPAVVAAVRNGDAEACRVLLARVRNPADAERLVPQLEALANDAPDGRARAAARAALLDLRREPARP